MRLDLVILRPCLFSCYKAVLCSSHIGFLVFSNPLPEGLTQSLQSEYSNKSEEISVMGPLWRILMLCFLHIAQHSSQSLSIITHSHQELHIASHSPTLSHQPSSLFQRMPREDLVEPSGIYDKPQSSRKVKQEHVVIM